MLLVIPLSVAALLNALKEIREERAPLIPSCHYSVPLLLVVLLTQVLAAVFVIYWFSKCCKCARSTKASRLATSMTAIMAAIYTIVIISFAVSVYLFVNKTTNTDNAEEPPATQTATVATTATDSNSNQESEVCIETSSPPLLFATFYLVALLLFLAMAAVMTCCDYHYKRKKRNFLLYLKDTVRIYENEGREEYDEETAL